MKKMINSIRSKRIFAVAMIVFITAMALTSCAPDPYNLHPSAYRIEKVVTGASALEREQKAVTRQEYILLEGYQIPGGGIVYKVFQLRDIKITADVGNAILARKVRYPEVFGLLTRGAIGEGADGMLTPRVALMEMTRAERTLIESENRDREFLIQTAMEAKRVPSYEAPVVAKVFAYARYQLLPDGVWVETEPGRWIVKGGRGYVRRVMGRAPIVMQIEDEFPPRDAEILDESGDVRGEDMDPETAPDESSAIIIDDEMGDDMIIEEPVPLLMDEPTPEIR